MRNAARLGVWAMCVCVLMFAHTPLAAGSTPTPWVNQDIGAVGVPGSASASGGVFTVSGAGADIWGTADAFQAVMQPITGDVQIVARVASIQNTNTYAKAGVMLRGSLTAGSADVILDLRPNGSIEFMYRAVNGGSTTWVASTTQAAPAWLKLARTGTTITAYVSSNGSVWSQVGSVSVSLPVNSYVGLAVTSHDTTQLNTSTFDNIAVTGGGLLPSPWTNQDVGAVGVAGSSTYASGVFTLKGAGADIWGTADAFQEVSQPLSGDVQLIARVTAVQNTNTYAKAGIMLRDSSAAGAAHVILDLRPNGSIEFMTRSTTNGQTTWLASTTQAAPVWLKLTRAGSTVTGSVSANGTSWTQVGVTTLTFGASPIGALVVTSHDTTQLNTSTFDNVSAGPLPVVVPAPSTPASPSPSDVATNVATPSATLTWTAAGATSYDVRFGTTNPPSPVASSIATASYAAAGLVQGATYYWQIVARNSTGTTTGPVWSFSTQLPPPPPPGAPALPSPVSGATGVSSGSLALAWSSTGATSYDVYFGATNPPSLAASSLAVAAYSVANLQAGTSYFWQVVAKNGSGSTAGPVWSFATQVAAPAAPSSPSPTSGATGVDGSSVTMTWTAGGATTYDVLFGTTNPPGQVASNILTPSYSVSSLQSGTPYYWQIVAHNAGGTTAGAVWSFTTLAPAPATVSAVPSQYSAITDRLARTKPPVPAMGPANSSIIDPTFGSKIARMTDGNTRPGLVNRSFRVPSNSHLAAWNADSTMFYVMSNDGTSIPFKFDPSTMTASRINPSTSGNGGFTLAFYVEPQFSLTQPNIVYGVGGSNNRTISSYDFTAGTYTTIVNLDNVVSGLSGYVGTVQTGGTSPETLLTFFGGGSQDQHYYGLVMPLNGGPTKLVNTVASTINGVATGTLLNFHIHAMQIDKTARYVFIYPTAVDLGSPRYAAQEYIWDTATDVITPVTTAMINGGHDAAGYGVWVNKDCCTSSSWDAGQWQFRSLATPAVTYDLISPVLTPQEVFLDDHETWNNAQPDRLVPLVSATYRYGNNTTAWRAWDDEIIALDVAAGTGATVWRFAHHRSNVGSDSDPTQPYFWYEPIANISPNGRWVLFTSNWEKTLGTDSAEGTARQDVFLLALTPLQ